MRKRKFQRIQKRVTGPCYLCKHGVTPDYKEVGVLKNFLTSRGKILAKGKTGICAKHQRKLARAIKRARTMALL